VDWNYSALHINRQYSTPQHSSPTGAFYATQEHSIFFIHAVGLTAAN
jgi:hypothetical protein